MDETIRKHISRCFAEESRAASRAEVFAMLAEKDGRSRLGRLFRALARAGEVRAARFGHLMRGKIGTTDANLGEALEAAKQDVEAYEEMIRYVKTTETSGAVRKGFIQSRRTREEIVELASRILDGEDPAGGQDWFVCSICGHIHMAGIPESCPVCGAVPGRFQRVE